MTERRRIHAIKIRGFRGIDALDLDFTDGNGSALDIVVLAGANGSGKTTVLEAILPPLDLDKWVSGDPLQQVRFGWGYASLLVMVGKTMFSVDLTPKDRTRSIQHDLSVEYFSAGRAMRPLAIGDGTPDHRILESIRLQTLEQRLISTYYRGLRSRTADKSSVFDRLQKLWHRFDAHGRRIEVIPRDNNPGSGDTVVLCDEQPIPEDITSLAMAANLASKRPDIPRMVPLDALSSGQKALFAFAGPLIFRDQPADIVLIDEPEQHMHVQWQRLLLPALRELCPDTQFIVATHSEDILDSVLSYERFILVDNNDPRAVQHPDLGAAAE